MATVAYRSETSTRNVQRFVLGQGCGIEKSGVNILGFQVWIGSEDRFPSFTGRQKAKQASQRKPHSTNAGLAGTDRGIDRDAIVKHDGILTEDAGDSYASPRLLGQVCEPSGDTKITKAANDAVEPSSSSAEGTLGQASNGAG